MVHAFKASSDPRMCATSLPCQHVFCDSCLSKMGDGERISCPQCRRESDVESYEAVEFTATQQWDQLLEIAGRFAALEDRLGPDTNEEEEEENLRDNFIAEEEDDDVEARFDIAYGAADNSDYIGLVLSLGAVTQPRTQCQKEPRTRTRMTRATESMFRIRGQVPLKRDGGWNNWRRRRKGVDSKWTCDFDAYT